MTDPQDKAHAGANRLVVGAHYGLSDWLLQRVTAVILTVFTLIVVIGALISTPLTYERWVHLFNWQLFDLPVGKSLTFIALLSLVYHAWVGTRDIWMDYIKPTGLRLTLYILTAVWLIGTVAYGVQILGRI